MIISKRMTRAFFTISIVITASLSVIKTDGVANERLKKDKPASDFGLDDDVKGINTYNADNKNDYTNCSLAITDDSRNAFSLAVLKKKYNFIYFELLFKNFTVNDNADVIDYNR